MIEKIAEKIHVLLATIPVHHVLCYNSKLSQLGKALHWPPKAIFLFSLGGQNNAKFANIDISGSTPRWFIFGRTKILSPLDAS